MDGSDLKGERIETGHPVCTVNPRIIAGSQLDAGSPINAGSLIRDVNKFDRPSREISLLL